MDLLWLHPTVNDAPDKNISVLERKKRISSVDRLVRRSLNLFTSKLQNSSLRSFNHSQIRITVAN